MRPNRFQPQSTRINIKQTEIYWFVPNTQIKKLDYYNYCLFNSFVFLIYYNFILYFGLCVRFLFWLYCECYNITENCKQIYAIIYML
jgi:hypothetical protein